MRIQCVILARPKIQLVPDSASRPDSAARPTYYYPPLRGGLDRQQDTPVSEQGGLSHSSQIPAQLGEEHPQQREWFRCVAVFGDKDCRHNETHIRRYGPDRQK
jgi:hypothetical protein